MESMLELVDAVLSSCKFIGFLVIFHIRGKGQVEDKLEAHPRLFIRLMPNRRLVVQSCETDRVLL